jgi:uncharacterized membrane protein
MRENNFAAVPVALYGFLLLMTGLSYVILARRLILLHGKDSPLAIAIGKDSKGVVSLVLYVAAIGLCSIDPRISISLYVIVAVMWVVPDRRIERRIAE